MKRLVVLALSSVLLTACTDGPEDAAPTQEQTPAERGMAAANANACTACHALDTTRGVGPGWGGIYGATRILEDGRSVIVDDAYLLRAIREPAADIVEGFDNVMVTAAVTDAQIADIIALIKELRGATTP